MLPTITTRTNNTADDSTIIKSINCKNYHIFNLRKTTRISRLNESNINISKESGFVSFCVSGGEQCENGFSLTQNGGHVVYIIGDFASHIQRWYKSIIKYWRTPESLEKMLFEEQYLTSDNIPVAIDKCLKFLDTYNLNQNEILFNNNNILEQPYPHIQQNSLASSTTSIVGKLLVEFHSNAWNVHLLPHQHSVNQISILLLLYFCSMNQCVFTEQLLSQWIQIGQSIDNNNNEQQRTEQQEQQKEQLLIEKIKNLLHIMPEIYYTTLRRVILCLAK